jgi:putative ABC transport system ATP-binding protein
VEVRSLYREPERREHLDFGALEYHDVFKIFRSGPAETVALRGLDLRIEPRELVGLFGPSGSGKSTALRLAAGLDEPSAGEVRAFGRSLTRADDGELARYRARELAIVFQGGNLWPLLSARDNVELIVRLAGRTSDLRRRVDQALDAFDLRRREHVRAGLLSGGEQQRVAIAAAAAKTAPLMLADEPTAELDERNEENVLDALRRLRDTFGSTVVVVTHAAHVADAVDRVIELRDGAVA